MRNTIARPRTILGTGQSIDKIIGDKSLNF